MSKIDEAIDAGRSRLENLKSMGYDINDHINVIKKLYGYDKYTLYNAFFS